MAKAKKSTDDFRAGGYAVRIPWSLVSLPGVVLFGVAFAFPVLILLVYSFLRDGRNGQIIPTFTVGNYLTALTDFFYIKILLQTLGLGVVVATTCIVLGFPVAYFLARTKSRWRNLLIFLAISPLTVSSVIRNVGWLPILGDNGAINSLLLFLGVIRQPLPLIYNFFGVTVGLANTLLPYTILLLMIVVQRVNPEIEEAGVNLGASRWQLIRFVLLPLTKRGLIATFMLAFTIAISSYTTPAVMGGGKVLVIATFIQQQIAVVLKTAFGSSMTIILLVVAIAITIVSTRIFEKRDGA
jgi:putative spermidine/putrescine transport system permease protein